MSTDPAVAQTEAPFTYANDNPVNVADPSGRGVVCTLTFGYVGCPPAAKVFDEDLEKLEHKLCANTSYENPTDQTIAENTITTVGDFLNCVADDVTDLGWGPAVAGCLADQVIGTDLLDQLGTDFGLGPALVLDPIGTLFGELISVFTFVAATANDIAETLSNSAYRIQVAGRGTIFIPKNL